MNNKIMFKVNGENFKNGFKKADCCFLVDAIVDGENVGNLIVSKNDIDSSLSIDLFIIKQQLRAKGYGTKILDSFKSHVKLIGFKRITGCCSSDLINFYTKIGAYFDDKIINTYSGINNRFYINL